MNPEIQRGRFLVVVAIILASVVSAITDFWTAHFSPVSWLLLIGLFYALWRGQRWARWLLVGMMGTTPLVGFWFLQGNPSLLLIGVLTCYVVVAALLAFPPSIAVFVTYQRSRPTTKVSLRPPAEPREHVDPY